MASSITAHVGHIFVTAWTQTKLLINKFRDILLNVNNCFIPIHMFYYYYYYYSELTRMNEMQCGEGFSVHVSCSMVRLLLCCTAHLLYGSSGLNQLPTTGANCSESFVSDVCS